MQKRLGPALENASAFRHSAKEMMGLAYIRAGDHASAQKIFLELAFDPETPPGMRNRAQRLQSALFNTQTPAAKAEPKPEPEKK
jgi:hypothetical protein